MPEQESFRSQNRNNAKSARQIAEEQYNQRMAQQPDPLEASKLPLIIVYEDSSYVKKIKTALAILRNTMPIIISDRQLTNGADVLIRQKALVGKVAVMILMDNDFLAEDVDIQFLTKIGDLVQKGVVRVIPVRVKECLIENTAYARLQYAPDRKPIAEFSNIDQATTEVCRMTRHVVSELLATMGE